MGLDMYLNKRHYVQNWDFMKPEERHQITVKKNKKVVSHIDPNKITYIIEQCGYWRKANAIHQWFVDNVQEGQDDCKEYNVEKSQLEKLIKICKEIKESSELVDTKIRNGYKFTEAGKKEYDYVEGKTIKNPALAEGLLPTQEGFFFGSTDYDQYYMEDIDNTIEILEKELSIEYPKDFGQPEYYYRASW